MCDPLHAQPGVPCPGPTTYVWQPDAVFRPRYACLKTSLLSTLLIIIIGRTMMWQNTPTTPPTSTTHVGRSSEWRGARTHFSTANGRRGHTTRTTQTTGPREFLETTGDLMIFFLQPAFLKATTNTKDNHIITCTNSILTPFFLHYTGTVRPRHSD